MKKWAILLGGFLILLGGCRDTENETAALTEARLLKRPITALTSVIDHSHSHLNWSLTQELSQALRHFFSSKNTLYLAHEENFANASKYLAWCDPFELDMAWMKKAFPDQEFVVFTEMMNHSEIPLAPEGPSQLVLSARIKVVDLRHAAPRVILQEVIEQSHYIPLQFTAHFKEHSQQVPWGEAGYDVSPLGIAHETLAREIANRAEDYILTSGQ